MFLVKAGTTIQVEVPKSRRWFYTSRWMPYVTREDRLYDKEQVWDAVAVHNGRDVPEWARRNITEHGYMILQKEGKYALVRPGDAEYLD